MKLVRTILLTAILLTTLQSTCNGQRRIMSLSAGMRFGGNLGSIHLTDRAYGIYQPSSSLFPQAGVWLQFRTPVGISLRPEISYKGRGGTLTCRDVRYHLVANTIDTRLCMQLDFYVARTMSSFYLVAAPAYVHTLGGHVDYSDDFSGDYNDLTNKPNLFSGDYNDLTNKPTIPTVPTNVSVFTNDAGYLTAESQTLSLSHGTRDTIYLTGGSYVVLPAGFSGDYNDLTNKPTIFSGSYNDLTDKPTLFGGDYNDLTGRPNIHDTIDAYLDTTYRFITSESDPYFYSWLCGWSLEWDEIHNKPTFFSANYNDLANKPNIHDTIEAYLDTTTQFLRSYTETQNLADVLAISNSAGNRQIKNVANPTAAKDAVNKQTVDAIVDELRHYYDSIIDYQRRVIDTLASTATGDLAFDENGATKSEFTINNSGGKVHFSRGNLQYLGSGATYNFQFATNQFDIIGLDNNPPTNTGTTPASAYRDLFIWYSGSVPYGNQCARTSYTGTYSSDLTNGGWGELNSMHISNGGGENWRTLTMDEWNYLLQTRTCSRVGTTDNARFVHIMVNGIVGTIIFPDTYQHPFDVPIPARINNYTLSATNPITNYTMQQFRKMELAGAAFLPAAGYLVNGTVQAIKQIGCYWSTTRETTTKAKFAQLYVVGNTDFINATNNKNYALPVRLVLDVE